LDKVRWIVVWLVVFVTAWAIMYLYMAWQAWKLLEEPRQRVAMVVRKCEEEPRTIQMTMR